MTIEQYACGEYYLNYDFSSYGTGIYDINKTNCNVSIANNDELIKLLLFLNCYHYNNIAIDLTLNYMYYSRCDKIIDDNPITAKMIFGLIPEYVNSITTINLHNPATIGYFKCPRVRNISYNELWKARIESLINSNTVLVAPDFGSGKEIIKLAEDLKVHYAIGLKQHTQSDNRLIDFVGDVRDKDCIICDDIIDTGTTLINVIKTLKEKGAKSIVGCVTHAVLSSTEAIPMFDKLYLSNTVECEDKIKDFKNVEIVNIV